MSTNTCQGNVRVSDIQLKPELAAGVWVPVLWLELVGNYNLGKSDSASLMKSFQKAAKQQQENFAQNNIVQGENSMSSQSQQATSIHKQGVLNIKRVYFLNLIGAGTVNQTVSSSPDLLGPALWYMAGLSAFIATRVR